MYTYNDIASIKANRALQAYIGCGCGPAGIVVSSAPLATAMQSRVCLLDNTIKIRCSCVICNRQRYVTKHLTQWSDDIPVESTPLSELWDDADPDDLATLLEKCRDFLFFEKRCEHKDDICLSAALQNDKWSHIYTKAPRVHLVYCGVCRKRGPMQLPIGLSDYVNEVMNNE